jgi:hypothetical protein
VQKFTDFFLPTAIPNRKAAAGAVAEGVFVAVLLLRLSGAMAVILLISDGKTPIALVCSGTALVMALVTIGTWKRIRLAPLIGLLVGVAMIRGIAFFKRNDAERQLARQTQ